MAVPWEKGYLYGWTGEDWEKLNPEQHKEKYMAALADLLENAPDGHFATLFCKLLIASEAFIKNLYMQNGILTDNGSIQSAAIDPTTKEPLVIIKADGLLKAIKAVFRDIQITGNSYFEGDIISGVLFSSNQKTGEDLPPKTFSSSDTAKTVWDYYGARTRNVSVSGSWNGSNGVYGLTLSTDTIPTSGGGVGLGGTATRYILDILLFNQTTIRKTWADSSGQRDTLGSSLVIDGGRRGPTFRLDLPNGDNGLNTGDLYRDSAGFIRVKL